MLLLSEQGDSLGERKHAGTSFFCRLRGSAFAQRREHVAMSRPATAQVSVRIGYDFFHNRLAHAGRWSRHPIWGDVWRPRPGLVGPYFQPYTNGYWEFTDEYGWYWVSNDPFDDVVYHYGRWVYDPQWQWLWVPGYTWAPAWVVWREGDDYTGWMPMPPDEEFVSGA